jgi:thymidine kinase
VQRTRGHHHVQPELDIREEIRIVQSQPGDELAPLDAGSACKGCLAGNERHNLIVKYPSDGGWQPSGLLRSRTFGARTGALLERLASPLAGTLCHVSESCVSAPCLAHASGGLEVICGPMFSGKTDELIRRLEVAQQAHTVGVGAIKPSVDADPKWLVSLTGARWPATPLQSAREIASFSPHLQCIGVDEAQFFEPEIVLATDILRRRGVRVIVAGLDLDFRSRPFGSMSELAKAADVVTRLTARCQRCGGVATRSQRLVAGRPAPADDPVVQVGGRDLYEPRCVACYIGPEECAKTDDNAGCV